MPQLSASSHTDALDPAPTKLHLEAAAGFLCWPMNVVDLCKKDADLPDAVSKLAAFVARWEAKGRDAAVTERNEAEAADLAALYAWIREPDHAEEFSLANIVDWINRRPIATIARLFGAFAPAASSDSVAPGGQA
jgi:regulator of protease activity HflC (stomatin/prohibitin superfamily)